MAKAWAITAEHLERWADRIDAASDLPKLVRRLLAATAPEAWVEMRGDAGVRLPGWDGVVRAPDDRGACPRGVSVWEFSVDQKVKTKLDGDFEKRVSSPAPPITSTKDVTYVAVVARRFRDKQKWMQEKTKRGAFRQVRVYDADDLAGWLEVSPAVSRWFAPRIGLPADDGLDVDAYLEAWSRRTSPPLPWDLVLSGQERERQSAEVLRWLSYPVNGPLRVQAKNREEALLFVAATITKAPNAMELLARAVVVETAEGFAHAISVQTSSPLIVLPTFEGADVTKVLKGQAYIVIGLDKSVTLKQGEALILDELPWQALEKKLLEKGWAKEEAEKLISERGGQLDAMQRRLGYVELPPWAKGAKRPELFALLLAGGWVPQNEADRKVIERLGGDPNAVESLCLELEKNGAVVVKKEFWAPPFYTLSSPQDAWSLLGDGITESLLSRFRAVFMDTLGTENGTCSRGLAHGLAVSLVLLGQHNRMNFAERLLKELLSLKQIPMWARLSRLLPTLAEVSPQIFLERIENNLDGSGDAGLSPNLGLILALEKLGFAPEKLVVRRVALALARLADMDIQKSIYANSSQRPLSSLSALLHFFWPQSAITVEERIDIFRAILVRHPNVGFKLATAWMSSTATGGIMMPSARPEYLSWKLPSSGTTATPDDQHTELHAVLQLILKHIKEDATQWAKLLEPARFLGGSFPDWEDEVFQALESTTKVLRDPDGSLWYALRKRIHAEYRKKEQINPATLQRLKALYTFWQPTDFVIRTRWLFSSKRFFEEPIPQTWQEEGEYLKKRRVEVIEELFQQPDPWFDLGRLIQSIESVFGLELGFVLGESRFANKFESRFFQEGDQTVFRPIFRGFAQACFERNGITWLTAALHALAKAQRYEDLAIFADAAVRVSPENSREIWNLVASFGESAESHYWRELQWIFQKLTPIDIERAILKLIESKNVQLAFRVALHSAAEVSTATIIHVLETIGDTYKTAQSPASRQDLPVFQPDEIDPLFDALDRDPGISRQTILKLELLFLNLLAAGSRGPKYLSQVLGEAPDAFVDLICKMYRRDGEPALPEGPNEERRNAANAALGILEAWNEAKGHPGQGLPAVEREAQIEAWASKALEMTKAEGRAEVGTSEVARVLARAPNGDDDIWPCIAARRLLEIGKYPDLSQSLQTAKWNLRGVWSRGMLEGGAQERDFATTYREYADKVENEYPRTAAMLVALARTYEKEAEEHDNAARRRRIEHGEEDDAAPPPSPPETNTESSGPLTHLAIENLGLAPRLAFDFAPRLNLLTGDNSVGKTLALNIAWWALTGSWGPERMEDREEMIARPPQRKDKTAAHTQNIASISANAGARAMTAVYDARHERWSGGRSLANNLVVYARVDGSFSIWDPIRNWPPIDNDALDLSKGYHFTSRELLHGKPIPGTMRPLCKGMITDLVDWKNSRPKSFKMLQAALLALSPPNEPLELSEEPQRFSIHDARDYPKIKVPYGEVFPNHTSAGVMRILGLCYALVWAISEIEEAAGVAEESPLRQVTFLIDEAEAHLHPKWQRKIMTALLGIVEKLGIAADVQFIVTTHAPLILASVEPHFDTTKDALFDFNLVGDHIEIRTDLWRIRGDVTSWLASDVFDKTPSRSKEAEEAMAEAADAVKKEDTTKEVAQGIQEKLVRYLPEFDPFWVRWRFVAEKRGWLV